MNLRSAISLCEDYEAELGESMGLLREWKKERGHLCFCDQHTPVDDLSCLPCRTRAALEGYDG